ncbi:TonB-linked SusC/RagA family outer membrane protein [Breznakibacter xylanolyticus]|uniref:TonB-linked SusC/RagA family outer membrane protein n=1 Tax=Breznakibacter xylanolyticus TaxID=990 RepID=A0A2W7Q548_9BACT|nr:TonB-dependent receptor [Breznakibacter xylanolyticus]PZX16829.1 TonB-linked SusC/RagA family outer membrane protein [Breznakibacter xylanolyticus]
MKENLRFFSVVFFLSINFMLFGQGKTITGKVTDDTKAPLPGVSVVIEGTTQGTITDVNGGYSVAVPDDSKVLVYSFIGFESQKVEVAGKTVINVLLKPENIGIDEVVVVGYGTMKKSDLSGASVSVGEDKIKGSVITNLDQSLQGRAAGVTSVSTSGAPGSSSSIRVRGQATINSNAEPLYVIDGVIIQGGGNSGADFGLGDALGNGSTSTISPLSTINPSDIVSMEILKDASATAIYGAQGANGVVLITTKRGKEGDAKFSYEGMMAWQRQTKRLDMMNLREFAEYYNDLAATGELTATEDYADPSLLGVGTNWQDAIFRTAFQQQHQLSAQGGSDKVKYYVSGSYMNQDGTIIGSNFKRYSMRSNLDAQLKSWLKLGLNAMYSGTDERLTLADSDEGIVNYSLTTPPDIPIYNIDGTYATVVKEGYTAVNPIAMALMDDILLGRNKLNGSVFAEVTPLKNLVWHTELGFDISNSKGETYSPMVNLGTWTRASNESSVQKNNSTFLQAKNYLTYNGQFLEKHSYTLMLGQEAWESEYDFERVQNTGLPSDAVHNPALGTGTPTIGYGFGSSSMVSFFGRANYNFSDRYLLTYTYRRDASSNFGADNRWAGFHAVAGSWRFSNETFFAPLLSIINNGKLRLGWGQTGNSNIGGYKWGSSISKMPTGLGTGYRPANIPNTGIKWETQEQLNAGIDLSFLKSRINLTVDYYEKTSKDMLMQLQLPSYMGTRGNASSAIAAPYGNYGSIENKGLEITLGGRPVTGQFEWDSEFQISFNRNKLVALDGAASSHIEGYGQWSDVVTLTEVGQSLYSFYGYQVEGVYKDLADIQSSAKPVKYPANGVYNRASTVWVGDIKYKDLNNDGVIDEKDRTDIGSPLPKFTFGFNNTFRYKNFDLNIFVNGSYGNKVYNYLGMKLTHMNSGWTNQLSDVSDRAQLVAIDASKDYSTGVDVYGNGQLVYNWYDDITNVQVKNSGTSTPRATTADPNDNDRISDRYIEDGSYIRIKNITLGYTLPKAVIQKIKLENVRIYTNIQNVYTFTKYSGFDPEIGASTASANVYGLDNGRYPSPTVMSFGLNVTF